MKFAEMDPTVTIADQVRDAGGPVILVNTLIVPPKDANAMLAAWTRDAEVMNRQPGFISTQMHRGIAGSGGFLNYAAWESPHALQGGLREPRFP